MGINCVVIEHRVFAGSKQAQHTVIPTSLPWLTDLCKADGFVAAVQELFPSTGSVQTPPALMRRRVFLW